MAPIAGVDEAGRGPWAGPVVAAAVILHRRPRAYVTDSKLLSPLQREKAFHAIVRCASIGVGMVDADTIDRVNILQATLMAMQEAVRALPEPPDLVLVDGNVLPRLPMPAQAIVEGDRLHLSISAASIIAKVVRDDLMRFYHTLFPSYQFHEHKGYGTPAHQRALQQEGPCVLHRMSFRPVADPDYRCANELKP